jgi:cytochrome c551/c552/uncharacterized coiled-coil DUF342 family protein
MTDQEKDPVVHSSLSKPLFISSALLLLSFGWALYDEVYGTRPWKGYEARFAKVYSKFLKDTLPNELKSETQIKESPEYKDVDRQMQAAEKAVMPQVAEIDRRVNLELVPRSLALNEPFQEVRGHVGALTYQIEISKSPSSQESMRKEIAELKRKVHTVKLPKADGSTEKLPMDFATMDKTLQDWKTEKATLLQKRVDLLKPATELRAKRDKYLTDRISDVSADTLNGLRNKMSIFEVGIRQIHVKDVDLVDRCESCHVGTEEPVTLTAAAMGGEEAFISHPDRELLKIHDPEKFGCTPCHGGNGVALTSIEKAHGYNEHWLWPLHAKENLEAGCQQCHSQEIVTEMAPTLDAGREIFRLRGCMACHRYEGFDRDPDELSSVNQDIRQLTQQKAEWTREIGFTSKKGDDPSLDSAAVQEFNRQVDDLKVRISGLDAKIEQDDDRARSLVREIKKVGPSLKEVRMKMHKEWLPVWLKDPHVWRPGTKMPTFRLDEGEIKKIAAFIWQSGVTGDLPHQPAGDPEKGKDAFETRGCMACHSMGEGDDKQGGTFAANLSRVGEKDNYDYLVRWVHNPRQRTLPYCPFEKKDITEADYQRAGLPFVFDTEHSKCPNDGHELLVMQMTPMPSLRLSEAEARDIASYLETRKHDGATYANADYLDDPSLKTDGQFLVRFYGCAGCHEIAGLEEEQRIGTELTKEGTKPIERLDFALLGHRAEAEGWYTHKGFFEHKLANPAVYDQGKEKAKLDRLKMPNFNLTKPEIDQLTTFLTGSVDPSIPSRYFYAPADQRRDIIEGWWVVRKYNCMGCHQVHVGQTTVFMTLPRYQDPDWKDQRPPTLIGEGARVNPQWLMGFLNNPSLTEKPDEMDRDGVRRYLHARMPTFYFSDGEIQKLVRFFAAMSSQAAPYIADRLEPLSDQERTMARQLFSSEGAPCLKCHATGDPKHDAHATAPNFLLAKERLKPGWARRWMLDPAMMSPGTAMPSGLFRPEGDKMVFAGPTPASFNGYNRDHAQLLVRYMFQFTPEELTRLRASAGAAQ